MRYLAVLCLLAMPAVALAQPIEITGADTFLVWWPPVENTANYELKIIYSDGAGVITIVGPPPQSVTPRKGIVFRVQYRPQGYDEWSPLSNEGRVCPMAADGTCDLVVGMPDFGLVMEHWGERVDE